MTNNIDINIDKTASSCHIDLFNKQLNKNVAFSIYDTALYSKDIIKEKLINAYELDDKAIVEAITYTNSLALFIQADNMSLISEEVNRMAVYADGEPVSLITAIKVIDEEGNELRSSIQAKEDGVELIIEEEVDKATVTLEFSSYLDFESGNAIFLRSFGELDYWYDISSREIYTVDAEKNKKLYIKLTASHISSSSYTYAVPSMISETIFFSNYKKCFFKIDGSTVTKIKDETNFFMLMHLYDDVYITSFKNSNAYDFTLVEFTNIEAATYEVLDTHSIKLSKSASEYCYSPLKSYDYDNKLHIYFYSYQHNSYIPSTDQYICARIDKEAKRFDFTDIEPFTFLVYEDEEYKLVFKWADKKYYLNNKALTGTSYSYPSKPFTLINDGIMYFYSTTYNAGAVDLVSIDLVNAKILKTLSVLDKMWSNGCYAGRKSIDLKSVADSWDMFKDCDLNKRRVRSTTKDDFILTTETTSSSYVTITDLSPLYIKKEVVQNKKFLIGYGYTYFQSLQRGNVISAGITVTENTDVEIKPFSSFNFYFDNNFIIEEEKDYNLFTSITDTRRIASNNIFNLAINEAATIFNKADDKYNLDFAYWGEYTETFEDDSPKLIKWTNSTYTEEGLTKSNIRAYEGSYAGYMGRDTKGGSNVPDYYSEFETIGEKIEFSYYNSFTQYNQYLKVYIDNVEKFSDSYNSTTWKTASINLAPNKKHIVKIFFEDSTVEPSNDKGFFIDNLICNAPIPEKNAVVYFKTFDYGMFDSPQGASIIFNDLEVSSNITQTVYYSIDNGAEWIEFNGIIPNVDNITLKAVFTKPTVEEEAYVKFSSVTLEPGEFEYISYADTSRKVYNKDNIKTIPLKNSTITMNPDGRYKLLFKDGSITTESFGDVPVIPYEFTGNESYGEASVIEDELASDGKCCRLLYNASFSSTSASSVPGIKFTVRSDKLTFKTKCTRGNNNQIFYVYVNNNSKLSFYPKVSDEFETRTIELDPNVDSVVWMTYGTYVGGTYSLLIDDITIGSITPTDYSYVETRPIDMSLFPSSIECSIETVDMQSTHELTKQYFYSVNDSEWIEFDGTLPNVDNIRIKSLYTKASVDDIVDATFESIVIKHKKESEKVITFYADIERQVVKTASINIDTYRRTLKNYISIVDTYRQAIKEYNNNFDTIRKVNSFNEVTVNADTLRIVTNTASSIQDMKREVIKTIKVESDVYRKLIKAINKLNDLNRRIAKSYILLSDTERKVEHLSKLVKYFDTIRLVEGITEVELLLDTLRVVYEEESPFDAQLDINLIFKDGVLKIENQEYK